MQRIVSILAAAWLGLSIAAASAAEKPQPKPKSARFIQQLEAGKRVTIVTMGTSLTADPSGWPKVMFEDWLDKEWPGQVTLFNEGVGSSASSAGPTGQTGLDVLPKVVAHMPDTVFIEFATNDANTPYNISLADSKRNLMTIMDEIWSVNRKTEIILQTMNSCKDTPSSPNAANRPQLAAYFQGYRDVAKKRRVLLVDNYPNWLKLMNDSPSVFDRLVPDGIHPQLDGYREVLLPQLKATLMPVAAAKRPGKPRRARQSST